MITPRFHLKQTDTTVTITIRAPYCNLRELDVCVEDDLYLFLCKPYYLRLNLPGKIVENNRTKSCFDADSGEFSFTYDKLIPGEDFKDLDFITKLLCKKVDVVEGERKIEILSSEGEDCTTDNSEVDAEHGFGFALRGGYSFSSVSDEFREVFDVDPFKNTLQERGALRLQEEKEKFNLNHYLSDLLEDEEIREICQLDLPHNSSQDEEIQFTEKELDFLKDLSNVEFNLSPIQVQYCNNSLLDILYAYCYDRRTTFFEGTCESGWTIAKISASLSWFDAFNTPKEALTTSIRRCLIYPLYRHYNLAIHVLDDLKEILKLGEKMIIRCLINLNEIFIGGDCGRYILNNLFIKDYIIYVMKWDKSLWTTTINETLKLTFEKEDLGLNLLQIESTMGDDLANDLMNLKFNEKDSDDSDTESESDSACETSDSYTESESDSDSTSDNSSVRN